MLRREISQWTLTVQYTVHHHRSYNTITEPTISNKTKKGENIRKDERRASWSSKHPYQREVEILAILQNEIERLENLVTSVNGPFPLIILH